MLKIVDGSILFEIILVSLVFLIWMLILGFTEVLANVLTGGNYRVIIQAATLTLAMLWYVRYRG